MQVDAPDGPLLALIESTLSLFDVRWTLSPMRRIDLDCELGAATGVPAVGGYLQCAQMLVDTVPDGLRATTARGASLVGRLDADRERWHMIVPPEIVDHGLWPEIEDLLSLVLTTGWRRAGWVPLHGGGLTDGERGVVICAGSGGGKTTFTLAMVRRGWRSLGDDKLLLGKADPSVVAAVKHMLNVDPAVAAWFPELGDLGSLPEYSAWTPKRRVSLARVWPGSRALQMRPTHLVSVVRRPGRGGALAEEMGLAEAIDTLLRQSVIPRHPDTARPISSALAQLAQRVQALRVVVHDDAYEDASALDAIEQALQ